MPVVIHSLSVGNLFQRGGYHISDEKHIMIVDAESY